MYQERKNVTLIRMTKGPLPKAPFIAIKEAILGKKYNLSIVFTDRNTATQLHKQWKHKNTPADILSFPLSEQSGEMFLSLEQIRTKAKEYNHTYDQHLIYMFIHGCVHLLGFDHGQEMEKKEEFYRKKFIT